jgi:hypothetical protein
MLSECMSWSLFLSVLCWVLPSLCSVLQVNIRVIDCSPQIPSPTFILCEIEVPHEACSVCCVSALRDWRSRRFLSRLQILSTSSSS